MEYLPNVLGEVSGNEEPVYGDIVPQMTRRIKALPLNTRYLQVVGLSCQELTSLVNISSKIRPIPSERHPK